MPTEPSDTQPEQARERFLSRLFASVWRSYLFRIGGALALGLLIGLPVGLRWLYDATLSEACEERPYPDLSIRQLIALKQRKDAWQRDPDPAAVLELSPEEITGILRGETPFGFWLEARDGAADATIAWPSEPGCYNISFQGEIEVRAGVLVVRPERLRVGDLDLTPLAGGRAFEIRPERVEAWLDHATAKHLENTERLTIGEGVVRLQLYDRYRVW